MYVLTENDNDEITITTKYGKTIKTIKIKQKNATKYTITKNETDNDYSEGHSETYNGFFYILGSVTGQQQIKPQKIKPQRFGAYGDPYIITSKNQLYYLDIPNGNIRLFDSNTKNNKLVINGYIANLSKKNNQELLVDYLIKSRKFELLLDFDKLQFTQIPSFINKIYLNYNQEELLINMETFEIIKSTLNQDIKITEKYNKSRFIRDSKYKSFELEFRTIEGSKKINKGFQFEIDLVLENEDEIIIFEAKQGLKARTTFILLQLYYPLIYLSKITNNRKKIRTIFIDIISNTSSDEVYQLTEFNFIYLEFDNYEIVKSYKYY